MKNKCTKMTAAFLAVLLSASQIGTPAVFAEEEIESAEYTEETVAEEVTEEEPVPEEIIEEEPAEQEVYEAEPAEQEETAEEPEEQAEAAEEPEEQESAEAEFVETETEESAEPYAFYVEVDELEVRVSADRDAFEEEVDMTVTPIDAAEIEDAVKEAADGRVRKIQAVDIAFVNAEGFEVQPVKPVQVVITPAEAAKQNEDVEVVHIDNNGEAETVDVIETEDETVAFEADSFSPYAVVYTVDFEYSVDGKVYQFRIDGGESVTLSVLAEALGILDGTDPEETEAFLQEVENVEFTDPSLVSVSKAGSDWNIESLQPFKSEEELTVTMKNGDVFRVAVTDDQWESPYDLTGNAKSWVRNPQFLVENEDGQMVSPTDGMTIPEYANFSIHIEYKLPTADDGSGFPGLKHGDEIIYPIPSWVRKLDVESGDLVINGDVVGSWQVENGVLVITLHDDFIDDNAFGLEGSFDLSGSMQVTSDSEDGSDFVLEVLDQKFNTVIKKRKNALLNVDIEKLFMGEETGKSGDNCFEISAAKYQITVFAGDLTDASQHNNGDLEEVVIDDLFTVKEKYAFKDTSPYNENPALRQFITYSNITGTIYDHNGDPVTDRKVVVVDEDQTDGAAKFVIQNLDGTSAVLHPDEKIVIDYQADVSKEMYEHNPRGPHRYDDDQHDEFGVDYTTVVSGEGASSGSDKNTKPIDDATGQNRSWVDREMQNTASVSTKSLSEPKQAVTRNNDEEKTIKEPIQFGKTWLWKNGDPQTNYRSNYEISVNENPIMNITGWTFVDEVSKWDQEIVSDVRVTRNGADYETISLEDLQAGTVEGAGAGSTTGQIKYVFADNANYRFYYTAKFLKASGENETKCENSAYMVEAGGDGDTYGIYETHTVKGATVTKRWDNTNVSEGTIRWQTTIDEGIDTVPGSVYKDFIGYIRKPQGGAWEESDFADSDPDHTLDLSRMDLVITSGDPDENPKTLVEGTDYTVSIMDKQEIGSSKLVNNQGGTAADWHVQYGFKITFLTENEGPILLHYSTVADFADVVYEEEFTNKFTYQKEPNSTETPDGSFIFNGAVGATYQQNGTINKVVESMDDKDTPVIKWHITANEARYNASGLVIKDTLPEHLEFDLEKDLEIRWIYNGEGASPSTLEDWRRAFEEEGPDNQYFKATFDETTRLLQIELKDIAYKTVEFNIYTQPELAYIEDGEEHEFENKAEIWTNSSTQENVKLQTAAAKTSVQYILAGKDVVYNSETAPNAVYTVTVNKGAIDMNPNGDRYTVEDAAAQGSTLRFKLPDSLEVTKKDGTRLELVDDPDAELTENQVRLEAVGVNSFTLDVPDDTALTITYKAYVSGVLGETADLGNTVTVKAGNETLYEKSLDKKSEVQKAAASITESNRISIRKGSIGTKAALLDGAEFSIYDVTDDEEELLGTITTGNHGTGIASTYPEMLLSSFHIYKVVETKAPEGYKTPEGDDAVAGTFVFVSMDPPEGMTRDEYIAQINAWRAAGIDVINENYIDFEYYMHNLPTAELQVKKVVAGNEIPTQYQEEKFTFTFEKVSGSETGDELPENKTVTIEAGETGTFDEIAYSETGTYIYKITEQPGRTPHMTYDQAPKYAKVVISDSGAVTVTYGDSEDEIEDADVPEVTNIYHETKAVLQATKAFEDWGKADRFTFNLAAKSADAPMPAYTQSTATEANKTASFSEITFDKEGTYEYTITEVNDHIDGVIYDTAEHTATVTVTEDPFTHELSASVTYENGQNSLTITNRFASIKVNLQATKEFEDWSKADSFTFKLEAVTEGAPMPTGDTATATEQNPTAVFGQMTFEKAGEYEYTITEINDHVGGVTYDTNAHRVVVTVTKDPDTNELSAEVKYDSADSLTITNTFEPVQAELEATKQFNDWAQADEFTFRLQPKAGAPMPAQTTDHVDATVTESQLTATFGNITYEAAGTYTYTITEIPHEPAIEGITYDTAEHEAVVTVTADPDTNKLTASVKYDGNNSLIITNLYASAKATLQATKAFEDWGKADSFTFDLAAVGNAPLPEKTTAEATEQNPTAVFGEVEYKTAGTYRYTITEEKGDADGVTYDTAAHNVVVTVTKDGGNLVADVKYDSADSLTITNTFTPATAPVEVTKAFNDWGKADSFTFELAAVTSDAPMPTVTSVNATKDAPTASFGDITFEKAGTYEYTITEKNDGRDGVSYDVTAHNVVITVSKDEDNKLSASVKYDGEDSLTVTNTYTPVTAPVEVTKEFNDWGKADSFTFELAAVTDGAPLPAVTTAEATKNAPKASFGEITFEKAGTYEYTITEKNDGIDGVSYDVAPHTVKVTVTKADDATNALSAEVKYDGADSLTVTNTYTPAEAEIKVTKEFNDWGKADKFTFDLVPMGGAPMPEGFGYVTVTEDEKTASFGKVTYEKAGTYNYQIVERNLGADGVSYDVTPHVVTVTVTKADDATNKLTAEVVYDKGEDAQIITNTFTPVKAAPEVTKEFNDWGEAASFTFELAAVTEGAPMPEEATADATQAQKTAVFGEIEFVKAGTYEYTLKEVLPEGVDEEHPAKGGITYDTKEHKVTVTVTKAADATNALSAKIAYDDGEETLAITNTYIEIKVNKYDNKGEEVEAAELTLFAEGSDTPIISWESKKGEVFDFSEYVVAGNTYVVKETKTPVGYYPIDDVTFTFDRDGSIATDADLEIDEDDAFKLIDAKIEITVDKVDEGGKPVSGAVLAVKDKDGKIVDQWTTDSKTHTIANLEANSTYTLTELTAPSGYQKAADITFTTGSKPEAKALKMVDKKDVVPDTGDHSSASAYAVTMFMAMLVLAAAFIGRKRYSE